MIRPLRQDVRVNRHDAKYILGSAAVIGIFCLTVPKHWHAPENMLVFLWMLGVLMSYFAFALFRSDKARAQRGQRRIAEATLWFYVVFGGAIGAYIAMRRFHHKTKRWSFRILVPLIAMAQFFGPVFFVVPSIHET